MDLQVRQAVSRGDFDDLPGFGKPIDGLGGEHDPDRLTTTAEVRRAVEDFNERVRAAFYQPLGGPPLITQRRDVDAEVERWRERRR